MLEHTDCPRCQAPNLDTEVVCFACGASLRPLPKRRRSRPPDVPWMLWLALALGLAAAGILVWQASAYVMGYRQRAGFPTWYLPAAGALSVAAGQLAFWDSRRRDRRWWRLKRAPLLKLSQTHVGDTVWVRGRVECSGPLYVPYLYQECIYYRYVLRRREDGETGWKVVERETKAVDFHITQGDESVYVPSGHVVFEAGRHMDIPVDPSFTTVARVWALPLGIDLSVCGQVSGDTQHRRLDALDEEVPVVATWRLPDDHVRVVAGRARFARIAGWSLTILGAVLLAGGLAGI